MKITISVLLSFAEIFSFKPYAVEDRLVRAKRSRAFRELLASAQAYFQRTRTRKPISQLFPWGLGKGVLRVGIRTLFLKGVANCPLSCGGDTNSHIK